MGELTDNESGLLHLAHKATNALFLLQLYIENVEKSSKTPPDFYTYKKPPQNHKKNKAPEITGVVLEPDVTFILNCKKPDYTSVGDYTYLKERENKAILLNAANSFQISEDAFEVPKQRAGYKSECCHKTVFKRCKGCPYVD
jgi:hypothetical protein